MARSEDAISKDIKSHNKFSDYRRLGWEYCFASLISISLNNSYGKFSIIIFNMNNWSGIKNKNSGILNKYKLFLPRKGRVRMKCGWFTKKAANLAFLHTHFLAAQSEWKLSELARKLDCHGYSHTSPPTLTNNE